MEKVEEYRKRACECRNLSVKGPTEDLRDIYRKLAEMWDRLAEERIDFFVPEEAKVAE